MPRLLFWRFLALVTSGLLQARVLLIAIAVAYVVGWIIGSVYARGF